MPKLPPTTADVLQTVRVTTPPEWHEPALDRLDAQGNPVPTEQGQILTGNARNLAELAKTIGRAATRQMFVTAPGFEPAGFAVQATMVMLLDRTKDLGTTRSFPAGKIIAEGPRGRTYRSQVETQWFANDPDGDQRTVELVCDLIGEPGNLDYLADPDGNLTIPGVSPKVPDLEVIVLVDQSQSRSGIKGVLELSTTTGPSTLTDNGAAPTFSPRDVGLYVTITFAGDISNVGRILQIIGYEVAATPATDTNLFARTITLNDVATAQLIDSAQLDDGGAFTIFTAEARESTPDDVQLLPALPVAGDAFYFGGLVDFSFLDLTITTPAIHELDLAWEYWDGATWTLLPNLVDASDGYTIAGVRRVSWSVPGGWASVAVNGLDRFWIRARVSAFTSTIQQPLAGRLFIGVGEQLLADPLDVNGDGQISWTILDPTDLGIVITSMTAPSGGRDNDLDLKLAERTVVPRINENIDALRRRGSYFANAVSPTLLERELNQVLNPYGQAGEILDAGDGFTGLFWDVPTEFAPDIVGAWDMYGPGDIFPDDPTMLPLSKAESRWHFFVCVPPPTLGEYGTAWDEGPTPIFVEAYGTFIGGAWDYAFTDGSPFVSEALYKQAYDRIKVAKGGGIAFTFIQCDVPACPA